MEWRLKRWYHKQVTVGLRSQNVKHYNNWGVYPMVPWGTNIWNNPHVIRQHMAFPRCQPAYRHGLRKTSDAKEPPAGCLTLGSQIWKEIRSVTCLVEEGNMLQKPHKCIGSFSGNWEANIKDLWLSLSLLFEKLFWRFCPTIIEVIWTSPNQKQQSNWYPKPRWWLTKLPYWNQWFLLSSSQV